MAIAAMLGSGIGFNYSEAAPNDPMEAAISELQAEDVVDMIIIGANSVDNVVAQYKNPANRDLLVRVALLKGENDIAAVMKHAFDVLSPITTFTERDLSTAIAMSQPGTEEFKMGCAYGSGNGYNQNDLEAFNYYKKAADMGHARAMCYTGLMYENGKGTDKNPSMAVTYFEKAALSNDAYGQFLFGDRLVDGTGCEKNVQIGVAWLEKAAAQNNVGALIKLAEIYKSNSYSIIDNQAQTIIYLHNKEKAIECYRKARDTGKAIGQYEWGRLYDRADLVPEDDAEAVKWYQKAADQEYYNAMDRLADMFYYGHGVEKDRGKHDYWNMRKKNPRRNMIASNLYVDRI